MTASIARAATRRWIGLAFGGLISLLIALPGCNIDPYCLACAEGDGGTGDDAARFDADNTVYDANHIIDGQPGVDGCSPEAEQCDNIDHDCDGDPMNGFDTTTDPANCGSCGHACSLPGAAGTCVDSECQFECLPNFHDNDPDVPGCEYYCVEDPGGVEIPCNLRDDDCNGETDEDFESDINNCGECFHVCVAVHATAFCDDQGTADVSDDVCSYTDCADGYANLDGDDEPTDILGCEYHCPVWPTLSEEECNGKDDDCDGLIDELPIVGLGGDCYPDTMTGCEVGVGCTGECAFGTKECSFGVEICTGYTGPEPTEQCDAFDHDCDGDNYNGFDIANDPNHCGESCTVCNLPHAINGCHDVGSGGECYAIGCQPGWVNVDGDDEPGDVLGCEYECTKSGPEVCDGKDNDCDTYIDEAAGVGIDPSGITVPSGLVCKNQGECDGPTPVCNECDGVTTWRCDYSSEPGAVEVDSCGRLLVQETLCDGKDNDCDQEIDESYPQVANTPTESGDPCDDGGVGICKGTGTYMCDPFDDHAVICDIDTAGQTALDHEECNNLDDNCNGVIDELEDPDNPGVVIMVDDTVPVTAGTTSSGDSVAGFLIDQYEASRPDADAGGGGSVETMACSVAGRVPWRTVTHAEAEAACAAAGKRLCTEEEWQRACEGDAYYAYPYAADYDKWACNGWGYDYDCSPPNDHFLLYPTGNDYGCPATAGTCVSDFGAYDMSGNVQEWTSSLITSGPDTYRVRGGTYQTQPGGLTCQHAFIAFDDTISFPSLGFRCCQDLP